MGFQKEQEVVSRNVPKNGQCVPVTRPQQRGRERPGLTEAASGSGLGGRKGGGGVRPPGLWGGCRGPPRRQAEEQGPAVIAETSRQPPPGGTGSSSALLGPGPARPGQRGLPEPRAGPTGAWLQTLPSLHVSPGAASQLGADGRPGSAGAEGPLPAGRLARATRTCHLEHVPLRIQDGWILMRMNSALPPTFRSGKRMGLSEILL